MKLPHPDATALLPPPLQARFAHQWARYLERHDGDAVLSPDLPDSLPRVWALSDFVAESCIQSSALMRMLIADDALVAADRAGKLKARVHDALGGVEEEAAFMRAIRECRRREMVRIAWRDLAGAADLAETLADLSELADWLIEAALAFAEDALAPRFGRPADGQRLIVLALGKLGGGELNFSSDVDLIFAYASPGQTDGRQSLDHQAYFTRLAQRLIRYLAEATADGQVWRVDMRLRPFGDDGPLVTHAASMEHYYAAHGREWERYAWIKARVAAGDHAAGERLLATLRPFVYRRYLDYGVFESLREMKAMINRESEKRGEHVDLKRSPGGIREIEFIGQGFQLIRAGRDRGLQHRGIRETLARLADRDLLPRWAERELQSAYVYLRQAENRLQMQADQQTHRLPEDALGRLRLAWSMGCEDWPSFRAVLDEQMRGVHEHFERMFASPQLEAGGAGDDGLARAWREGDEAALRTLLAADGYEETEAGAAAEHLAALANAPATRTLTETARQRLAQLVPLLVRAAVTLPAPARTLARALTLIQAMAGRSVYLALLVESPLALSQLVRLCAASPWIAEQLARMPLLLDELLDPRSLYAPPEREGLARELSAALAEVPDDDVEQLMDRLRQFKAAQVLKVAAADVTGALPLMRVSDQLTWIAEVILDRVLAVAGHQLAARHGPPWLAGEDREAGFGIVAYGKLGGIELGYGSDLDVVFLYESGTGEQLTRGERPIDNAVYFARLAQRVIHLLGTYTSAGTLYEIDIRLRPSGASGLLVSSLDAFSLYQQDQAWVWEHQALVRARFIAGAPSVASGFAAIRERTLCRERAPAALRREVREMRERMWRTLGSRDPVQFDLKKDPGGIADIEFLVQYNVLLHARAHPALVRYTDNIRLLQALAEAGVMDPADAALLTDAYKAYRDRTHALTLQAMPAVVPSDEVAGLRAAVGRLWEAQLGEEGAAP
ncbi:bifunctional [glutamate--ammonia ligase]-adenylyl-L-tyrosine phosphorylase/[glutamate--ammonia-ligase] adenylyltransferase [Acidihalobacter prosperus]|uniref:bifunctional [glutamate--ammonia ligase]-adenylyl-L-tyrosine phosphorylase/[glutamate--ammonia-ligase] adenylyltransferase n=1 Tax=Acidihalobacter prosperus TaxID=160660 RepID=UPI0038B38A81